MTDFKKVEEYYTVFNEWSRLDAPSGKLEFEITKKCIRNYLNDGDKILDLGGGPGRYSIELAQQNYEVHLADISEELLEQARRKMKEMNINNIKSINKVNAVDLAIYESGSFDVVLLMGPLYHLTDITERELCLKEVYRVLKDDGIIIAIYIPKLSGAIGVVDRFFQAPSHVNNVNLREVFDRGVFNNNSNRGFQEGYYPSTVEITELLQKNGFNKKAIRSIRGFGYTREEKIMSLKEDNEEMYNLMIELIDNTSEEPSIIETSAHALYVGTKSSKGALANQTIIKS